MVMWSCFVAQGLVISVTIDDDEDEDDGDLLLVGTGGAETATLPSVMTVDNVLTQADADDFIAEEWSVAADDLIPEGCKVTWSDQLNESNSNSSTEPIRRFIL